MRLIQRLKLVPFFVSFFLHAAMGLLVIILNSNFSLQGQQINIAVLENTNFSADTKNKLSQQRVIKKNTNQLKKISADKIENPNLSPSSSINTNTNFDSSESQANSLPNAAENSLITKGAQLTSEIHANRTDEARKAGYTGTAILLVLIDEKGIVRDVQLLNHLDFGLGEKAIEIVKKLKFIPAKIKDTAVATKIRLSIHFKSTN